jgi:hypothetical protein
MKEKQKNIKVNLDTYELLIELTRLYNIGHDTAIYVLCQHELKKARNFKQKTREVFK